MPGKSRVFPVVAGRMEALLDDADTPANVKVKIMEDRLSGRNGSGVHRPDPELYRARGTRQRAGQRGLLTQQQALEELKARGEELGVYTKV